LYVLGLAALLGAIAGIVITMFDRRAITVQLPAERVMGH
jgi:hypothetical protein